MTGRKKKSNFRKIWYSPPGRSKKGHMRNLELLLRGNRGILHTITCNRHSMLERDSNTCGCCECVMLSDLYSKTSYQESVTETQREM